MAKKVAKRSPGTDETPRTPRAPRGSGKKGKAASVAEAGGASTPAAPAGRPSAVIDTRVVYCGDCLEQLKRLPDGCVDLVYIDPPFNSNRNYEMFWGETKEKRAFEDRHASTQAYIDYMRPRCVELHRVLKKTGSFYYHCDWHASHYVKVMLDQIFGENRFENEIVWKRHTSHSDTHGFGHVHDILFRYSVGATVIFNAEMKPYSQVYLDKYFVYEDEYLQERGRHWRADITAAGLRSGETGAVWRGFDPGKIGQGRHWFTTPAELEKLVEDGRVYFPTKGGVPKLKRYEKELKGMPVDSVWDDIPSLGGLSKAAPESLGYPTQKPLALLERIIKASSNTNDIVLDAFCGCGTALVAAQNLGRQWVGIDISPTACRVMAKRLRTVCKMKESEPLWLAQKTDAFVVRDLPWTIEKLKAIPPFEFENWAVIALGGIPNTTQVGDMGIDGRIFPVGTKPDDQHSMFAGDWFPIQVKHMERVGRPDIDAFEAVMEREDRQRGFFVAFGYSSDAEQECANFHKRTGRVIKLITVREILDEQHVQKM